MFSAPPPARLTAGRIKRHRIRVVRFDLQFRSIRKPISEQENIMHVQTSVVEIGKGLSESVWSRKERGKSKWSAVVYCRSSLLS